jgi:glycosyltransferase involved in cell wall biosynthesis
VKARVNHPGVDTQSFYPENHQKGKYYLFIGERDDLHGFPLIEAINRLADERIKFRILTLSGSEFELDEKALRETYQQAIVTLCLDRSEPFGLIPLEAMACGIPVIAVDEGGYRETVVDSQTGFLVERDPELIYRKLLDLAGNPNKRLVMGKAGRKRAISQFSWQGHGQKLQIAIEEINHG